ncbi:MAG: AAA family ATPase [Saprospiraceae bacterium]|nr:AAA family ATPase [Saprospiraceae bacterium]
MLRSIALILCGSSALGELIGDSDKWIKRGAKYCSIEAQLITSQGDPRKVKLEILLGDSLSKLISRNQESLRDLDEALEHTDRNYLTIGYGVSRRIGSANLNERSSSFSNFRADNVSTLFHANASLFPLESWVMDLDYRDGSKGIATVKKALNQLLPSVQYHSIDKKKKAVQFKTQDGVLAFDQLSDGFQISANWMGDLLYRITSTYQDHTNPLKSRFILLIDEVALHLHPEWQRTIIQSISDLFPNAQIIATTHSPFVAQQAGHKELFTIIRKENKDLDLFHYENDPRKLLIHQIIMSDLFGVETDESVFVEEAKNQVRQIKKVGSDKKPSSSGTRSKKASYEKTKIAATSGKSSRKKLKPAATKSSRKRTSQEQEALKVLKDLQGVDYVTDISASYTSPQLQQKTSEILAILKKARDEKAKS